MQIDIKVEEQKFKLNIGKAYNDWTWLAHYASRTYSKIIYPQGVYIPCLLYVETKSGQFHPHPHQKIFHYLKHYNMDPQEMTVVIKIRKANHIFTQFEKKWEAQAFGEDRFLSETKFAYKVANVNRKKDFYFKVVVSFHINQDIRGLVNEKRFKQITEVRLEERQLTPTDSIFEGTIKLPYGKLTHRLFYLQRESPAEQYSEHQLKDHKLKAEDFKVSIEPQYIPTHTINNWIEQDMKITDSINKTLQQKQLQAKKRNTNSSLCCFTFEQLWAIIQQEYITELNLNEYEEITKQHIRICIQKNLNELYEIFFYYFIIDYQEKDKKEDLSITYQHLLHFLRDYQIIQETRDLLAFVQFYNKDYRIKSFQDTLDLDHHGIKFPQFVTILLRAIQFLQTSTFMMKGETFDSAVAKVFEKVTDYEKEEDQFNEFRRNIRENPKIITFMRNNCPSLKKIFIHQATTSVQNSASEYCIRKEEVKRMLQMANITEKNNNVLVDECFSQLQLKEDAVYYYQFLSIMQWLAITVIGSEKEGEDLDNMDEESLLIIEKIKYLIDKVVPQ